MIFVHEPVSASPGTHRSIRKPMIITRCAVHVLNVNRKQPYGFSFTKVVQPLNQNNKNVYSFSLFGFKITIHIH